MLRSVMDLSQTFATMSPAQQEAFLQGPSMNPPACTISNFDNPPNKNALAWGILITGAVLSTLAVIVRLYPLIFARKRFAMRAEDYLVVSAWAISGAWFYYAAMIIKSTGVYVHQWDIRYIAMVDYLYYLNSGFAIYGVVVGITKTAILLDWLHIFVPQHTHRLLAWSIYVVMSLNFLYYTVETLMSIFACLPQKRIWGQNPSGTCMENYASSVSAGVINMASNFVMLVIPQKMIWGLHLSRSRRAGISALFAIGAFACICAVARLSYSIKLFMHTEDFTYVMSPVGLWTVGEITSGFLLIGVPYIPRLFKEVAWLRSVISWIRSWTRSSSVNSAKELPSWYKMAPTVKKRHDLYSDLDDYAPSKPFPLV